MEAARKVLEEAVKKFEKMSNYIDPYSTRNQISDAMDNVINRQKNKTLKDLMINFKNFLMNSPAMLDEFIDIYLTKPTYYNTFMKYANPWDISIETRKERFLKTVAIKLVAIAAVSKGSILISKMLNKKKEVQPVKSVPKKVNKSKSKSKSKSNK